MAIDYDKVDLLTQLDSTRRGWQDCEAELSSAREREAGLLALVERLRDRLIDSDKRLCNHHEHSFVVQQAKTGLGRICPICSEGSNVFLRNAEVLSLAPPAALDDLRRRERSIGAEEELRRIADLIETEALDERFAALFCADMRDRADAIAAERDHIADVGKMVNHPKISESSRGEK